jgi:hypothetical protein
MAVYKKKPAVKCKECGESFLGRVDKKFCSDQCRNTYNNRLNSDSTNLVRNINNILRRNRRILEQFNPEGDKAKVSKARLIEKGFNFKFFTSSFSTKAGNTYFFCYEQGYMPMQGDYFFLVVNKKLQE